MSSFHLYISFHFTLWVVCVLLESPLAYNMYLFNLRIAHHILIKILDFIHRPILSIGELASLPITRPVVSGENVDVVVNGKHKVKQKNIMAVCVICSSLLVTKGKYCSQYYMTIVYGYVTVVLVINYNNYILRVPNSR